MPGIIIDNPIKSPAGIVCRPFPNPPDRGPGLNCSLYYTRHGLNIERRAVFHSILRQFNGISLIRPGTGKVHTFGRKTDTVTEELSLFGSITEWIFTKSVQRITSIFQIRGFDCRNFFFNQIPDLGDNRRRSLGKLGRKSFSSQIRPNANKFPIEQKRPQKKKKKTK